jgi:hypothetical protein
LFGIFASIGFVGSYVFAFKYQLFSADTNSDEKLAIIKAIKSVVVVHPSGGKSKKSVTCCAHVLMCSLSDSLNIAWSESVSFLVSPVYVIPPTLVKPESKPKFLLFIACCDTVSADTSAHNASVTGIKHTNDKAAVPILIGDPKDNPSLVATWCVAVVW